MHHAEHQSEYNGAKQFRIQVLKGKDGGPYIVLDTYKATSATTPAAAPQVASAIENTEDLPFWSPAPAAYCGGGFINISDTENGSVCWEQKMLP